MPSTRRLRVFGLAMACLVLLILYFSADSRRTHSHDFYTSTVKAMDAKTAAAAAAKDAENAQNADVGQRLRDAEAAAKKAADAKTPNPNAVVAAVEKEVPILADAAKNVAGRIKVKGGEKWDMGPGEEAAGVGKEGGGGQAEGKEEPAETQEEHDVEVELNLILKRSPSTFSLPVRCSFPHIRMSHAIPSTDRSPKNSHHLLEIILPPLRQSQGDPRREIHHRAWPLRRRARPPPARPQAPGLP